MELNQTLGNSLGLRIEVAIAGKTPWPAYTNASTPKTTGICAQLTAWVAAPATKLHMSWLSHSPAVLLEIMKAHASRCLSFTHNKMALLYVVFLLVQRLSSIQAYTGRLR